MHLKECAEFQHWHLKSESGQSSCRDFSVKDKEDAGCSLAAVAVLLLTECVSVVAWLSLKAAGICLKLLVYSRL